MAGLVHSRLWYVLIVGLLAVCSPTPSAATEYLQPSNPKVLVDSYLVMNCTVRKLDINCNSSDLDFTKDGVPISDEFVTPLNENVAELNLTTANWTKGDHTILCFQRCFTPKYHIGSQNVLVIERLVKPNITGCIVYNWERMVCTWEPKFQNPGVPTTQQLLWYIALLPCFIGAGSPEHERLRTKSGTCLHPSPGACEWRGSDNSETTHGFWSQWYYTIRVEVLNALGRLSSDNYCVDHEIIVKPDQVKGLSLNNRTSSKIVIGWETPAAHKPGLRYKIEYKSTEFETEWKYTFLNITGTDRHLSMTLEDLIPNAEYKINVTCHPREQGFWSDPSQTSVITLQDVPGAAPAVTDGSFIIDPPSDPVDRGCLLYWQSIPKKLQHGKLKYEVKISGCQKQDNIPPVTDNKCRVKLRKDCSYNIIVQGKTEAGVNSSMSLKTIYIEKEKKMPSVPEEYYFIKNNSVITLYWKKPDVYSVTAYWCKSKDHSICLDEIQWATAYGSNGSLSFVPQDKTHKDLGFAISAQELRDDRIVSSGMEFSNCLYHQDKAPGKPVDFRFSKEQKGGSLTMEWDPPSCKAAALGYSKEYVLEYCKVEECAKKDIEPKIMTVPGLNKTMTIQNLEPYSKYQVKIHAVSPSGMESQSETIIREVKKSGLTKSQIAGIAVGVILASCLIVAGCFTIIQRCKKVYKKYMDLEYDLPDDLPFEVTETNDYGDTGIMENGIMADGGPMSNRHGDGHVTDIGREITQPSVNPHQVNGVRSLDSGDTVLLTTSLIRTLQHQNKPTPESLPMSESKTQEPDHDIPVIPPPKETGSPKVSPATSRQNSSIPAYTAITEMPDGSPQIVNINKKQSAYLSPRNLNNGNNNRESGSSSAGSASTENDTSMNSVATYSKVAAPGSEGVEPSAEGTPFSSTESKTSLLGDSHLRKSLTDNPATNRSSLQQTQPVAPAASVANPTSISDSNLHINPKAVAVGLDHGYSTGSQMSGDSMAEYVTNKDINPRPVAGTKQPDTGTVRAEKDMGYCTDKDLIDSGVDSRDVCNNVKTKTDSETGTNVASPTGVSGYITEEMLELGASSKSVTV